MISSSGAKELNALVKLVSGSVATLLQQQPNFPSLYDATPRVPLPPTEEQMVALQAAQQLVAMLHPMFALSSVMQIHTPACLRVAIEAHVCEAIRAGEGAPGEGLHVNQIAKFSVIDPKKLARVLRLLSSRHIFREVSRDTFTNTHTSLLLDTGKKPDELKKAEHFYGNTNGLAAIIAHTAEDVGKGSVYLADTLLNPKTAASYSPTQSPYSVAFNIDVPIFVHWAQHPSVSERFANSMKALALFEPDQLSPIMNGFAWSSLPKNALIVDVGGGIGSVSLVLAKQLPEDVKIIVQDREEVIDGPEAKAFWEKESAEDLNSGRVVLQIHDFFSPQNVQADVYLMRTILHDWADKECIEILSHLKLAAKPHTRVIVIDRVVGKLYPDPSDASASPAPFPLLPATDVSYCQDLQMLTALNGMERSKEQFAELAIKSGWILEETHLTQAPTGRSQMVFKLA